MLVSLALSLALSLSMPFWCCCLFDSGTIAKYSTAIINDNTKWSEKNGCNFFLSRWIKALGMHLVLVHLCYLILCTIFISLFLPHWPVCRDGNISSLQCKKLSLYYLWPLSVHHAYTQHTRMIALHFIVFIHRKYIWMQKWRSGLQQIKLAKNTIVLANIPPGCMNIFFSLRQCDCYLSLHCTALS